MLRREHLTPEGEVLFVEYLPDMPDSPSDNDSFRASSVAAEQVGALS
jgi:hypothetical protein